MSIVLDPKLYAQSKRRINDSYGTPTSAYRSMAIVKDYKKHGGRYTPRIKGKEQGVSKWLLGYLDTPVPPINCFKGPYRALTSKSSHFQFES